MAENWSEDLPDDHQEIYDKPSFTTGTPAPPQAEEQFKQGERYEKGNWLEKNLSKAFELYSEAAAQGHAAAQNRLGQMYNYGQGVNKNIENAVVWYTMSASQGFAEAQFNLGYLFHFNKAIKDSSKALEWYAKAAAQGHVRAQISLEQLQSSQEIPPPIPKPTTSGSDGSADPAEQYKRGDKYFNENDYINAIKCYSNAAEQGYAKAQFALGFMYNFGCGVEKNISKAAEWYGKAAAQGNERAKINLQNLTMPK